VKVQVGLVLKLLILWWYGIALKTIRQKETSLSLVLSVVSHMQQYLAYLTFPVVTVRSCAVNDPIEFEWLLFSQNSGGQLY
jgi:hypothetical protein